MTAIAMLTNTQTKTTSTLCNKSNNLY